MTQEELFHQAEALLDTWLDRIDWVVVTATPEQRHQALMVKNQVLQAKHKLDRRRAEGRWFDRTEAEGLERALFSLAPSLNVAAPRVP
jgi:hypothetical protein